MGKEGKAGGLGTRWPVVALPRLPSAGCCHGGCLLPLPACAGEEGASGCVFVFELRESWERAHLRSCAGSRFGATAVAVCCSDPAPQSVPSPMLGLGSPYVYFGGPCTPHPFGSARYCISSLHKHTCCLSCRKAWWRLMRKEAVLEMMPPSTTSLVPCKSQCKPEGWSFPRKISHPLCCVATRNHVTELLCHFFLLLPPFFLCCFYTCITLWSFGITTGTICIWLPMVCISLSSRGHFL